MFKQVVSIPQQLVNAGKWARFRYLKKNSPFPRAAKWILWGESPIICKMKQMRISLMGILLFMLSFLVL